MSPLFIRSHTLSTGWTFSISYQQHLSFSSSPQNGEAPQRVTVNVQSNKNQLQRDSPVVSTYDYW